MTGKFNPLAAYRTVANSETDPIQQLVMLYDGAIKFLRLAATDIEIGDLTAKAEHSDRALDIISYLQSILDFERGGDVAPALDLFYTTLSMQILSASAALDEGKMRRAAELIIPVREAWAKQAPVASSAFATAGARPVAGSYQKIA